MAHSGTQLRTCIFHAQKRLIEVKKTLKNHHHHMVRSVGSQFSDKKATN